MSLQIPPVRVFHSTMFAFYSHVVKLNAVNKPWWNNYLSSRSCGHVLSFKRMRRWGVTNPFTWSDTAQFTGIARVIKNLVRIVIFIYNNFRVVTPKFVGRCASLPPSLSNGELQPGFWLSSVSEPAFEANEDTSGNVIVVFSASLSIIISLFYFPCTSSKYHHVRWLVGNFWTILF